MLEEFSAKYKDQGKHTPSYNETHTSVVALTQVYFYSLHVLCFQDDVYAEILLVKHKIYVLHIFQ